MDILVKESMLYQICLISVITFFTGLVIIASCYHMIFKPDYRPEHRSMPFVWFQMVYSIYKGVQKAPILAMTYNSQAILGMCKVLEKQKVFSFKIWNKTYVFLFTPEAAEVVLGSMKFIEKSGDYRMTKLLVLDGLLASKANKWRKHRRMLTPSFHFKILQEFSPLIRQISKMCASRLKAKVSEPYVMVNELMKTWCGAILMKTAIGLDMNSDSKEALEAAQEIHNFIAYCSMRLGRPWLHFDAIYNLSSLFKKSKKSCQVVHDYIRKIIRAKKAELMTSKHSSGQEDDVYVAMTSREIDETGETKYGKKYKAFMDLLLEQHMKDNSFTEESVLEESIVFFVAGISSMSSAVSNALYCIGLHKDVEKRLHEEIDEIVQHTSRDLTEDDLNSWKYLDCVIKESLRVFSGHFISREATERFQVGDYTISKGSTVAIALSAIHRDPRIYPDPEKFDPSRFYPENCVGRHPYAFIPFSAGPRNCIGQKFALLEMKLIISSIIRWYNMHSLDNRDELNNVSRPALENDLPIRIRFSPRENMKYEMPY